ncbi:MAG: ribosome silencing factor, partial [Paracoccaceae bacterium]
MTGAAATTSTSETLRDAVLTTLDEMKAEEIVQIDLRGKTSIGDTMIVCSGRPSRQVSSIADRIVDVLKAHHGVLSRTEGKETGDWVLIDAGDVIV